MSAQQKTAPHSVETSERLNIPCVTQDPREPAGQQYLDVCAIEADLIATSTYCPPDECGGHPICRPCYDLARREGLVL